MDQLKTGVLVLLMLVLPVSCIDPAVYENTREFSLADPIICYFLDGFLMVYCIVATALYFREKFPRAPAEASKGEEEGNVYQELERPKDTDPYQELKPLKRKKTSGKKNKSKEEQPDEDKDQYEFLNPTSPPPPLSPN